MFLFLVPFTIRQQCRIYAPRNFSLKASGFYPWGDATALAGEGGVRGVVCLIQASASNHKPKKPQTKGTVLLVCICQRHTKRTVPLVCLWFVVYVVCLKSDIPQHKRQVRSTGIAKRLLFMFLFQFPSIFPLNHFLTDAPAAQI